MLREVEFDSQHSPTKDKKINDKSIQNKAKISLEGFWQIRGNVKEYCCKDEFLKKWKFFL